MGLMSTLSVALERAQGRETGRFVIGHSQRKVIRVRFVAEANVASSLPNDAIKPAASIHQELEAKAGQKRRAGWRAASDSAQPRIDPYPNPGNTLNV
jgi:hypothetical protein